MTATNDDAQEEPEDLEEHLDEDGKPIAVYAPDDPHASPFSGFIPPVATRFKKGNSGGKGRPKSPLNNIGLAIQRLVDNGVEVKSKIKGADGKLHEVVQRLNLAQELALVGIREALKGNDPRWWHAVIERNEGKVADVFVSASIENQTEEQMRAWLKAKGVDMPGDDEEPAE